MRDMAAKNRHRGSARIGERHHNAVLNEDTVRVIRAANAAGVSGYRIANGLGVGVRTVYDVIERRTWAHVV
jgi:hypothetical protein